MIEGVLITESLRVGSELAGPPLVIRKLERIRATDTAPYQPDVWTLLHFECQDVEAEAVAEQLAESLASPGWYADFHSEDQTFVVFPGRVFRYRRGDKTGRLEAAAYGQQAGVPESQLDWAE